MKNKILNIILPILTFASLVGIWNLLLRIGALNKALFPYPSEVLNAVFDNHFIIEHIFTSLKSLFICVCIGYTIGFVVGFVLSFNKKINFIEDFLSFFYVNSGHQLGSPFYNYNRLRESYYFSCG
jgi:ABC-type nitrate/sulfonate/bicarbonate transport system permease component